MLREKRANGPIINDLTTGLIVVYFPVLLNVRKVGIRQGDYRGSFAIPKKISIEAPGYAAGEIVLENKLGTIQEFDFHARTDRVRIRIHSVYPPARGPENRKYGSVTQVKVLVEDDLDKLFAIPPGYARPRRSFLMRTPNLDPSAAPQVLGKPRVVKEHPCTLSVCRR